MKKFVSILLVLAMILALSTTAFAAENTNLTISDSTDRTYNGYKLLNLTTSLKCDHTEGETHNDTCYNYAYTVNEKYENILQELAGEGVDIIAYLGGLSSDNNSTYGTLRAVADSIYRAIQAADIAADKTGLTGNNNAIDQGYWLFADVSTLTGNTANSLVMVDTKGQEELTINPKVGLPTLEKKVKDTNDSTGVTTDWQDSADHDINDTVNFQITVTMPENLAGYDTYKMVIHDTMSAGLTLDVSSIVVTKYASLTDATSGTNGTVVTASFTKPTAATSEFAISCDNILGIAGQTVTKDTVFVVTYDATLNDGAVIGAAGNPNTAYLEFSNNPYGDGTGKTEEDKVIVFTYQLTINKVDPGKQPLKGAGFTLYKKDSTGAYKAVGNAKTGTGENENVFQWKGLDDGEYKLEETTVPAGYNKMADKEFTISATHNETPDTLVLTNLTSSFGTVEKNDDGAITGNIEDDIENNTGTILPETGAKGTIMLIGTSSLFILVAVVFMVTRKKMSIYED